MSTQLYATGRRKESVARVYVTEGSGNIIVNGKNYKEYFSTILTREEVLSPLKLLNVLDKYDIKAFVKGGGITGQSSALKLGISRVLATISEDYKKKLKANGFLSRDPRVVERKHYGKRKARRGQQSSKR